LDVEDASNKFRMSTLKKPKAFESIPNNLWLEHGLAVEVDRKLSAVLPQDNAELQVWKVKLNDSKMLIFDTKSLQIQDGDNLLIFAVRNRLLHLARFLIASGANIRQPNKLGETAYGIAKSLEIPLNKLINKARPPKMYNKSAFNFCFCFKA
jgi:hypothetical protein